MEAGKVLETEGRKNLPALAAEALRRAEEVEYEAVIYMIDHAFIDKRTDFDV